MAATRRTGSPVERPPSGPRHDDGPDPLTTARMLLVLHRLDVETSRCAACAGPSPCQPAQDAARMLVESGNWNAATTGRAFSGFTPPPDGGTQSLRGSQRRPAGWAVTAVWSRLRGARSR
jgi:hypothetical protein